MNFLILAYIFIAVLFSFSYLQLLTASACLIQFLDCISCYIASLYCTCKQPVAVSLCKVDIDKLACECKAQPKTFGVL